MFQHRNADADYYAHIRRHTHQTDCQQMLQIFKQLRQQTKNLGSAWKDDQYKRFAQDFDQDIMKNIQEMSAKMEMFSKYVEKMVQIHRMAQQQKYY